jgi:ribosomal protein S20
MEGLPPARPARNIFIESVSELSSAVDKAAKTNLIHGNKAANIKSKAAKSLATVGA